MVSYHSRQRAKERLGINDSAAVSMIEKGMQRGHGSEDFKKIKERLWLEKKSIAGYQALVYNGCCLIVSPDGVCITVYELPHWFGKKSKFDHNGKRIRNYARYFRMSVDGQ